MKLYVRFFCLSAVLAFFVAESKAAFREVHCPKEISLKDVKRLEKRKKLSFENTSFKLDGGSRAVLRKISYQKDTSFSLAYERLESRKVVCWYKTPSGFLGIRQR